MGWTVNKTCFGAYVAGAVRCKCYSLLWLQFCSYLWHRYWVCIKYAVLIAVRAVVFQVCCRSVHYHTSGCVTEDCCAVVTETEGLTGFHAVK